MKRTTIITIISLIFILASCNIKENRKSKKSIKSADEYVIAFYNVENLFDIYDDPKTYDEEFTPTGKKHWDEKRYEKKLNDLSWVLSNLSSELPAIIGLSEVENRKVVEDLANTKLLKAGNYKVVHEESPDTRGIDVALMYRSDLFEYVSHKSIPIHVKQEPNSKLRDILYVKGKFAGSNEIFHIFVNHWKSRRGGREETEFKRIACAETLKKEVDKILSKNKDANIIIMGDLNDEPENKSVNTVLFATNNTKHTKPHELYNLMYNKSIKEEGTNSRNYKWFMLDNLIVSQSLVDDKDFYVENKEGEIFKDDKILYYNAKANFKVPNKTYGGKNYYGGYSDHLAVYFILHK
ncbi:MAG: hypothetical protein GXO49_06275 [Chlorobi bacterium]|nr:hypothetical protein [Chlorobiota bacterium]